MDSLSGRSSASSPPAISRRGRALSAEDKQPLQLPRFVKPRDRSASSVDVPPERTSHAERAHHSVKTRSGRSKSTVENLFAPLFPKGREEEKAAANFDEKRVDVFSLLPDDLVLLVIRFVEDKSRMVLVSKRCSRLVLEALKHDLKLENKLESNKDVRRVCLFLVQLMRPRGVALGVTVEDYDNHPVWTTPRTRFRLVVFEAGDMLSRRSDAVSELRS